MEKRAGERLVKRSKVPGTTVNLLANPSKMPGLSWSMTAGISCPFKVIETSVEGKASICGSCYAEKGNYGYPTVKNAQWVRFDWARRAMRTIEGRKEFVEVMTKAIEQTTTRYFRVHDSGDLFSPAYTRCWYDICWALPTVRFWFPTRSWQASWVGEIIHLASLGNVTVRPSALHVDTDPPVIAGLAAGSGVIAHGGFSCPASTQGNQCGDCRACWDRPNDVITYHLH